MKRIHQNILKVLAVVCMGSSVPAHARMLDVMLFTGMGESLSENPIAEDVALALCEKSVPCLVSQWALYNFLSDKVLGIKPAFVQVSLQQDDWDIYTTENKALYLFMPKNYRAKLERFNTPEFQQAAQQHAHQGTPQEILTGFKLNHLIPVTLASLLDVRTLMEFGRNPYYTLEIDDLLNFFVRGTDDIFGLWNIVIEGHGTFPLVSDFPTKTAKDIDVSDAIIADFDITQFRDLLQECSKNIKTNFLYYRCCYGADYNLILPYITTLINERGAILGGIETPKFTIVSGSLTSDYVYTEELDSLLQCENPARVPEGQIVSYTKFFDLLRQYGNPQATKAVIYKDKELRAILTAITYRTKRASDPYGISGLPQMMYRSGVFRAVSLNDKITVLSEVLNKVHMLQKKPFQFTDKEAILVYPQVIPVPVDITVESGKPAPGIVSMQPGAGLTRWASITTSMNFTQFIKESLGSTQPVFVKYYYLEQISLINDAACVASAQPGEKVTLYDLFIFQKEKSIRVMFTGPDKKTVYFNEFTRALTEEELKEYKEADIELTDVLVKGLELKQPSETQFVIDKKARLDKRLLNTIDTYFFAHTGGFARSDRFLLDIFLHNINPEDKALLTQIGIRIPAYSYSAVLSPIYARLLQEKLGKGAERKANLELAQRQEALLQKGLSLGLDMTPPQPPQPPQKKKALAKKSKVSAKKGKKAGGKKAKKGVKKKKPVKKTKAQVNKKAQLKKAKVKKKAQPKKGKAKKTKKAKARKKK